MFSGAALRVQTEYDSHALSRTVQEVSEDMAGVAVLTFPACIARSKLQVASLLAPKITASATRMPGKTLQSYNLGQICLYIDISYNSHEHQQTCVSENQIMQMYHDQRTACCKIMIHAC
jgi:hypothetical protein